MNSLQKVGILIATTKVAQIGQCMKSQPHIIFDMGSNGLCPGMRIMTLVHTNHELGLRLYTRDLNRWQFKNNISVEGWR
jgi:hypothetical protein